jgi:hypothetical protein
VFLGSQGPLRKNVPISARTPRWRQGAATTNTAVF